MARRLGALCQRYKILHRHWRIFLVKPGGDIPHRCVEDGIQSVRLGLRGNAPRRKKEQRESGHVSPFYPLANSRTTSTVPATG
jgi:hypothetical protein